VVEEPRSDHLVGILAPVGSVHGGWVARPGAVRCFATSAVGLGRVALTSRRSSRSYRRSCDAAVLLCHSERPSTCCDIASRRGRGYIDCYRPPGSCLHRADCLGGLHLRHVVLLGEAAACWHLTIVGGVREALLAWRLGHCEIVRPRRLGAWVPGPSTSPLEDGL